MVMTDADWFLWRQGDEEGDTYEAPPCEPAAVKMPQRQLVDNVYLGNIHFCSQGCDITCTSTVMHANLK